MFRGLTSPPEAPDDRHVLAREVADAGEVAGGYRLRLDERAADAQAAGAGLEKRLGRGQVDAPGRHEPDLWKGTAQGLEVRWAADVGREDLDDIGPGLPGRDHLGRRERPRHHGLVVPAAEAD